MIFRTAVLQMRSRRRETERNISLVIDKMKEAKSNHADLLLLPECFITGYDRPKITPKMLCDGRKKNVI